MSGLGKSFASGKGQNAAVCGSAASCRRTGRRMRLATTLVLSVVLVLFMILQLGFVPFRALAEGPYVRYEAEYGVLIGCVVNGKMEGAKGDDYGTYSGEGFVGEIDYAHSKVTIAVSVPEDGEYELRVAYATAATQFNATFIVGNPEGFYAVQVSCSQRKGWGHFESTEPAIATVSLKASDAKVVLMKGTALAQIDYIEIGARVGEYKEPDYVADRDIREPTPGFTRYEAESGTKKSVTTYNTGAFSGTGYVGAFETAPDSHVSLTVNVIEEGEYKVNLAYAIDPTFTSANLRIHNSDGYYRSVSLSQKFGWGNFTVKAFAVFNLSLRAGVNTVSIYRGSGYFQVDFIEVGDAKIGAYKDPSELGGGGPPVADGYVRLEAEDGAVVNALRKGVGYPTDYGNGEYSGRGFVGSLDGDDCYIDFAVTAAEDGLYEVLLRYATAETETTPSLKIYAGRYGRQGWLYYYNSVDCIEAGDDWGEFTNTSIERVSVGLVQGENFIRVKAGFGHAEVDYIDLGGRIDAYEPGVVEKELISDGSNEFGDDAFGEVSVPDDGYRVLYTPRVFPAWLLWTLIAGGIVIAGAGAAWLVIKRLKVRQAGASIK